MKNQAPDLGIDGGRGVAGGKHERAKRAPRADKQVAKGAGDGEERMAGRWRSASGDPSFGSAFALLDPWVHIASCLRRSRRRCTARAAGSKEAPAAVRRAGQTPPKPGAELYEMIGNLDNLDCEEWREQMALQDALVARSSFGKIRHTADSSHAVLGTATLKEGNMQKTHIDLWNAARASAEGKEATAVNVEGHGSAEETLKAKVGPIEWLGNLLADGFVEGVIEQAQAPEAQAKTVGGPHREEEAGAKLLAETERKIAHDASGQHFLCLLCGSRTRMAIADGCLGGECREMVGDRAGPLGTRSSRPQTGNQKVHSSHKIGHDETLELHHRVLCGCIGREGTRKVAAKCNETPGQMGRQSLSSIKTGLQPGNSALAKQFGEKRRVRAELAASREEQLACVREELLRLREEHVAHSSVSKDLLVRLTGARQHEQPLEQTTVGQQLDSLQLELAALRRELHSGMTACREDARLAAERGASELRALAAEQHRDAAAAASAVTAEVARAAQEQRRALAAELHEAAGVREELHAITKGLAEGAVGLGAGDRAAPRAACAEGAAAAVARISAMHAGTPPAGGARTAGGGDSKRDELETVAEH
ncbi:unnamed protein product [Prorocentrum cordatum]|uniref:Uncharacterized protein n=1 Tax=Prorocentrum cordatum TaxID=2364126 RepID=A0ABN9T0L0_9DINO|nr:unnamed protein product [Polarella glacialis]